MGEIEAGLERYERASGALWAPSAVHFRGMITELFGLPDIWGYVALAEKRRAGERDRREWLADVECRLGLVVAGRSPHRGIVRRTEDGGWSWRCRRPSCWQRAWNYPSQPDALADAHAHAVTGDPARYRFTW